MQAGTDMNVGDYYQDTYKIKLNPSLPCLNVGGSGKPTYVPAELATVKRGQRKLKLDERQQAQMIREAAIKPLVSTENLTAAVSCTEHSLHMRLQQEVQPLLFLHVCNRSVSAGRGDTEPFQTWSNKRGCTFCCSFKEQGPQHAASVLMFALASHIPCNKAVGYVMPSGGHGF